MHQTSAEPLRLTHRPLGFDRTQVKKHCSSETKKSILIKTHAGEFASKRGFDTFSTAIKRNLQCSQALDNHFGKN